MKVTYDLPEELVREVKVRAAMQGRTVKDVMTDLLRAAFGRAGESVIEAAEPRACRILHTADGIPYFEIPKDAKIPAITREEALALEERADEEDALHRAGLSR
jgi:plasmid stability protein